MLVGICGKSNVGKTTFFSAATLVDAEISNRVFTTIRPNTGVSYVRGECPCRQLGVTCSPRNSKCVNGIRYVPVKLVDVAGLVPGAHLGKGLGNQFLSDIMEAYALIHVVDISGSTDEQGNPCPAGTHDPKEDVLFLEDEIDRWILGIIKRNQQLSRRMQISKNSFIELVHKQLTGLGIKLSDVEEAVAKTGISYESDDEEHLAFIKILREKSKPITIAANKIDVPGSDRILERVGDVLGIGMVPCSAESELALRRAAESGMISYMPGDVSFTVLHASEQHIKALNFIMSVMEKYGSTGVQKCIDHTIFDVIGMIVVYPVENEHKFSDKKGAVLPDAFLMKKGSTALDLAYKVHEDIGKKFISAVDARTGRNISASYELKDGDVVSIKASR
ncbi:redox-regulated ATPase YchF [Candidatus Woesearchaeota archaeon]|nr:redox-regulated ATPase YchF [Candidatus Woesearchaeota archaeon]